MITVYRDIKEKRLEDTLTNGIVPRTRDEGKTGKDDAERRVNIRLELRKLPRRDEVIFAYKSLGYRWWGGFMKYYNHERANDNIATIKFEVNEEICYVADAQMWNEAVIYEGERDYWYIDKVKKFDEVYVESTLFDGTKGWGYCGHYGYPEIMIKTEHILPEEIKLVEIREAKTLTYDALRKRENEEEEEND